MGHRTREVDIAGRALTRAEADDEYWVSAVLTHALFADAHATIDLLEVILQSPDTIEDLSHVEEMQRILTEPFPLMPRYWEPTTELDPPDSLSDDAIEHLLRVLGENIHPKRLQQFDDMIQFDLERAATEYGKLDSV